MKKELINLMAFLFIVLVFKSCTSDDNDTDTINAADMEAVKTAVTAGEWMITYYFDSDKDETSDYTGFIFTFGSDGVLQASDGTMALTGAWSVTSSDSSDDDSIEDDIDFNIVFASPELFEELSDDWDIVSYSNTKIELIDISGGDGSTDYLTFEKM
ncbi:hypothetical protein FK220_002440 [Flavobacteriaceae bacterium TP-CH-4]|uniref:Lipocalin-like domain-containing protein n=1 Tax=Pelagihabitans pacificus TaxID=2696054 RepID=A0A967ASL2_9FLAO|nr:hypothetical protein [Pelagihabitans pacificus]NHF58183.1 hypothetical protein [Pelagihabitans pacificus]